MQLRHQLHLKLASATWGSSEHVDLALAALIRRTRTPGTPKLMRVLKA